ncbi:NADH dehydrogenase [ubiquinone] 1 alpha subcomplex subunit N7bmp [Trichomonascus vanleenenianus]|uniref:complex I NDUFA12 subunit family protein n=1 Tax=Trichomonascus vanleenenianus TaxID=2268995 RepID=UPI003EC980F0
MSSSLSRVIRNFMRVGPKGYLKQMNGMGDCKAGTLVGVDKYGNKFFENEQEDEIHLRTRWVEYKDFYGDMSQIEPAWHFWLGYGVNPSPNNAAPEALSKSAVPMPANYTNLTGTSGSYMCYSTVKPKIEPWAPKVAKR